MEESNCFIFVFNSTHQALSGEKALKEEGINHSVINTPREFSVDCGISIRVEPALMEKAASVMDGREVVYAGVEPYYSRWM
ncbi:MAG: DUF3343 domain-containing protein [Actinomycetota bacterium]|nr:DUF3343 domain-containing protein [Actinomycetota bacterium]